MPIKKHHFLFGGLVILAAAFILLSITHIGKAAGTATEGSTSCTVYDEPQSSGITWAGNAVCTSTNGSTGCFMICSKTSDAKITCASGYEPYDTGPLNDSSLGNGWACAKAGTAGTQPGTTYTFGTISTPSVSPSPAPAPTSPSSTPSGGSSIPPASSPSPTPSPSPSTTPLPKCAKKPDPAKGEANPAGIPEGYEAKAVTSLYIWSCYSQPDTTQQCTAQSTMRTGKAASPCIYEEESIKCSSAKATAYRDGNNLRCAPLQKIAAAAAPSKSPQAEPSPSPAPPSANPSPEKKVESPATPPAEKNSSDLTATDGKKPASEKKDSPVIFKDVNEKTKGYEEILEISKLIRDSGNGKPPKTFKPKSKTTWPFTLQIALSLAGEKCGTSVENLPAEWQKAYKKKKIAPCISKAVELKLIDESTPVTKPITKGDFYRIILKAADIQPVRPATAEKDFCKDVKKDDAFAGVINTAQAYGIAKQFKKNGEKGYCLLNAPLTKTDAVVNASKILKAIEK